MEIKKISATNLYALEVYWAFMYKNTGWKIKRPIEIKWNWKRFNFVYEMIIQKQDPKINVEIHRNKSETNTD